MLYIATLAEIKADLGITDTEDDALLTSKAEGLQGRLDDFLGRTLLRGVDVEEVFDGDFTWLTPKRWPIESISALYIETDELSPASYRINKALGRIIYGNGLSKWPAGFQNIKVFYTGGYVAAGTAVTTGQTAMPDGIRRLFLMQFGFEWRNKSTLGSQSVSGQGASVSLAPAKFLPEVDDGLVSYKRF